MSEHERIQEALRECQRKFLNLFRESPLVLEMTSAKDDRYIEVNDTFHGLVMRSSAGRPMTSTSWSIRAKGLMS